MPNAVAAWAAYLSFCLGVTIVSSCLEYPNNAAGWRGGSAINPDQVFVLTNDYSSTDGITINGTLYVTKERDISITVPWIRVQGNGLFQIGAADCPHEKKVIITLTGNSESPFGLGPKSIVVAQNAKLAFYGSKGRGRNSWALLNASAPAGATRLTMAWQVDWQQGDQIVLPSTDYSPAQTEVATVQSASGNIVTLAAPIRVLKWGTISEQVDERCEVGLLTRTIRIQGANDTAEGAHLVANTKTKGGLVLEGVEFYNVGQPVRARYPIHLHLMHDAGEGCSIRDNSIWHSQFRAITLHATQYALVENNVAYDITGHAYFLEDGSEFGNKITHNLCISVKPIDAGSPRQRLGSDLANGVSCFWITNPNNTFESNVAIGTTRGYWVDVRGGVRGLSAPFYPDLKPAQMNLVGFKNNVAHSVDQCLEIESFGFDEGDQPPEVNNVGPVGFDPRYANGSRAFTVIDGLVCHHAWRAGAWFRLGKVYINNSIWADMGEAFQLATHGGHPPNDTTSYIVNNLFVGQTANPGSGEYIQGLQFPERGTNRSCSWTSGSNGFKMYDGPAVMQGCIFRSFRKNMCNTDDTFPSAAINTRFGNVFQMAASSASTNARFCNVDIRVQFHHNFGQPNTTGALCSNLMDTDGSISGFRSSTLVLNNGYYNPRDANNNTRCKIHDMGSTVACPHRYANLEFTHWPSDAYGNKGYMMATRLAALPGPFDTLQWRTVNFSSLGGDNDNQNRRGHTQVLTVGVGAFYAFSFPVFSPAELKLQLLFADQRDRVSFAFCFPPGTSVQTVRRDMDTSSALEVIREDNVLSRPQVNSTGSVNDVWGSGSDGWGYYNDVGQGVLYVTFVQRAVHTADRRGRDPCPHVGGCEILVIRMQLPGDVGPPVTWDDCARRVAPPPKDLADTWLNTQFAAEVKDDEDCNAHLLSPRGPPDEVKKSHKSSFWSNAGNIVAIVVGALVALALLVVGTMIWSRHQTTQQMKNFYMESGRGSPGSRGSHGGDYSDHSSRNHIYDIKAMATRHGSRGLPPPPPWLVPDDRRATGIPDLPPSGSYRHESGRWHGAGLHPYQQPR